MAISIRLLTESDHIQANRLYHTVYKKDRKDSFFNWEFVDAPFGSAIYVGAFDGDKLVGTQAAIPMQMINAAGELMMMSKSEDTLLDPAYRGQGLFNKMYDLLFRECERLGIKAIWGFTYAKKPFLNIGFKIPFDSISGVLVINPLNSYRYLSNLNSLNKTKDKIKIAGLTFISFAKGILGGREKIPEGYSIDEECLEDKATLIKQFLSKENNNWMLNEDRKYCEWRIVNNPYSNNYREITIKNKEGIICGNLIYNIRSEGVAYICQMIYDSADYINVLRAMITAAIILIKKDGRTSIIRFWGFKHTQLHKDEVIALESAGFYFARKGTGFVVKGLTGIDSDTFNIQLSRIYTQGNI
ncbi:hypothetical protein BH11BAC2_BH11BAC2_16660 [soil metagenome]